MVEVEVVAESVESALAIERYGASRVEFCDNMAEGGTTPSYGSIKMVRRELGIPLFTMIRPRGGDFVYSAREFGVMEHDIRLCGETGCDGVVFGMLFPDGLVDIKRSAALVRIAKEYDMQTTFHRAFDVCVDLSRALERIIDCGFDRVLTSGGALTAVEGIETIRDLVRQSAGRISVMPGSGVTPENAGEIISKTGCREIHGTFRSRSESNSIAPQWSDLNRWMPDGEKIETVIRNLRNL